MKKCELKSCKNIHNLSSHFKVIKFCFEILILISFSNGLFLQLERIRHSIRLCGQMHIFIKNVGINAKFTQKKSI